MTPQQLKASLLQEAIRGKLTDQRPEDGSAEELYRAIIAEKKRLIKAGKLKKEKPLPPIEEKDIPFDIPENWKWVRLGEIMSSGLGKTLNKELDRGEIKPYLCSINIYWSGVNLEVVKKANFSESEIEKYSLSKGDLLICEGGDVGRAAIWERDEEMYYQNALHRVRFYYGISPYFYRFLLELYKGNKMIDKASKGQTIKHFVQNALLKLPVPLPPLPEQERIVAKLEELLPLVERYGKAYTQLTALEQRFPASMRKSLLQEAIQGKLTDQRPEDGSAEDLYRAILAEKKRLIKAGKLKKEKPLPPIEEKDIPFDIPESWKWVRLGEIMSSGLGKTLNKELDRGEIKPYLCSINIYWSGVNLEVVKKAKFSESEIEKYSLSKGDLLICEGGDVGRAAIWERDEEMYYQNALHRVRFYYGISPYFYRFLLELYKGNKMIDKASKGQTIKHFVQNALLKLPVPLPPLPEQERIVAKLEELLPLCD